MSSNVSLSPAVTRQFTVLPISASLYSKPFGDVIRTLYSSPVAGLERSEVFQFFMGTTSEAMTSGIRSVARCSDPGFERRYPITPLVKGGVIGLAGKEFSGGRLDSKLRRLKFDDQPLPEPLQLLQGVQFT